MVARGALQNMIQDTDEPIRTFAARLRGQTAVCHFTIQCPNSACGKDISYQDEVIRDIIARGISDSADHRQPATAGRQHSRRKPSRVYLRWPGGGRVG